MNDVTEREDGFHNLWGFGWTGGGFFAALLCAGFFAWMYGSAATGLWSLVRNFRALPATLKGIIGAMAAVVAYLAWRVFQLMRDKDQLTKRLSVLEWKVGELEQRRRKEL